MKEKLKILTTRNGIALIAVLAILLILTLIVPVMFSMSESSTKEAVKGTDRQKSIYLARSGVEMAISTLKGTLKSEEAGYKAMYAAMKTKTVSSTYGVQLDAQGKPYVQLERIWYYTDKTKTGTAASKYVSGDNSAYKNDSNYNLVGYVDVTVTYDGDPVYYKVDETSNTSTVTTKALAVNSTTGEINNGYMCVQNDNYIVKGIANVKGSKYKKSAAVIETKDSETTQTPFVQYSGVTTAEAPAFVLRLENPGDTSLSEWLAEGHTLSEWKERTEFNKDGTINLGGNQCFADQTQANMKKEIDYSNPYWDDGTGYTHQSVYIFSTIGNMYIHVDGTGYQGMELMLGVYPGIKWQTENSPSCGKMSAVNMNTWQDVSQQVNFISFCATNILEVDMPIELRVNPTRTGRVGDGNALNASLFKMINLQAKDIVLDKYVNLFISMYNTVEGYSGFYANSRNTGKRMGTLVLSAPNNTPYSYYNGSRNTNVSAGKVYFLDDVYAWIIDYGNRGSETLKLNLGETYYKVPGDFTVKKVFNKGDVYYFNSEVTDDDGNQIGVSLINWYLETYYLNNMKSPAKSWEIFKRIRFELFKRYIAAAGTADTYKSDDMHYIGNVYTDTTLTVPTVQDEVYVVWDS